MKMDSASELQEFFQTKARELVDSQEMQKSFAQEGGKEKWINFLQTGKFDQFQEADRELLEMMIPLINTYALLTAYEQFKLDATVRDYIHTLQRMQTGEDLQKEMIEIVAKLPDGFKEAVRAASYQAQEHLISLIQAK
jgi:hypothetical protein